MIGKTISHYKILEKIGEGGMGIVYKAEDTTLHRVVALKFLPPPLFGSTAERERFFVEARAAAALDHPNICTIHEIDTVDEQTFIAMAYVPGRNLRDRIGGRPLPLDEAVTIALQLCNALGEAHAKGVIHRDVKPANVVISEKGHAILMDFGLAKLRGQTKLTRTGATVGTAAYMSPEQALGNEADRRSDIWSLGVVLYEMIAGRAPFRGDHEAALFYSIAQETPAPLTSLRSDVPMELERIVAKAMAKDPGERYQHVDDMRVDLKAIRTSLRNESQPSARVPLHAGAPGRKRWLAPTLAALVVVAAVVAALSLWSRIRRSPPQSQRVAGEGLKSLAVLPLANFSGDKKNEFFVDGMTEELITELAKIRSLKVISRTSVMRYKDTDKPLREIAKELGVATVLEGSVFWGGNRVRISAQLIDAATDQHLWANSYEGDLENTIALQHQVARAVAGAIRLELTPSEEAELARTPVVNPEAHELYLRGRYQWNLRGADGVHKAIEYFEQATAVDSEYAKAYSGLADAYVVLTTWDVAVPSRDAYPLAKKYARKALALDSTMAEPYATLGQVAFEYEWDWEGAERLYRVALDRNPNYATGHQFYAEYLFAMGRFDDSIREITIARELDPLSFIINLLVAVFRGRADEGPAVAEQIDRVAELAPGNPAAVANTRAVIDLERGHFDKFIRNWAHFESLNAETEERKRGAARLVAAAGRGREAFCREFIRQGEQRRAARYFPAVTIGGAFAVLGEVDSTMTWLERGVKGKEAEVRRLGIDPTYNGMESDPRFVALLDRLHLREVRERYRAYRKIHGPF